MPVQAAISRGRGYEADRSGAEICGTPLWLASALTRSHGLAARIHSHAADCAPATAPMVIINPPHVHDDLFCRAFQNGKPGCRRAATGAGRAIRRASWPAPATRPWG